jgi:hypothetical protein
MASLLDYIDFTQSLRHTALSLRFPQHGPIELHQCSRQVYNHHPIADSDRARRCWQEAEGGADDLDNPAFGPSSGSCQERPLPTNV